MEFTAPLAFFTPFIVLPLLAICIFTVVLMGMFIKDVKQGTLW